MARARARLAADAEAAHELLVTVVEPLFREVAKAAERVGYVAEVKHDVAPAASSAGKLLFGQASVRFATTMANLVPWNSGYIEIKHVAEDEFGVLKQSEHGHQDLRLPANRITPEYLAAELSDLTESVFGTDR